VLHRDDELYSLTDAHAQAALLLERQNDKLYGLKTDSSKPCPSAKKGGVPKRKVAEAADMRRQKILTESESEGEGRKKSEVKKARGRAVSSKKAAALSDSDEDFL
jgi:hypothetical protein